MKVSKAELDALRELAAAQVGLGYDPEYDKHYMDVTIYSNPVDPAVVNSLLEKQLVDDETGYCVITDLGRQVVEGERWVRYGSMYRTG